MPIEQVSGTSLEYYLIAFDEKGNERLEEDKTLLSETVLKVLSTEKITDVFLMSHGWLGDIPGAKDQYQKWIAAMAKQAEIQKIQELRPGFNPLLIGLHWPSKPWGNEDLNAQPSFDVAGDSELDDLIEDYAGQVSDSEATKYALRTIFGASIEYDTPPESLPPEVLAAYQVLIEEATLDNQDEEVVDFDPESIYQASLLEDENADENAEVSFGIGSSIASVKDKFLKLPRLLSYWKMKVRARQIGETSGFNLLTKLQSVKHEVRFHLIGHSFGTIVVSATIAGARTNNILVRPINSLTLIQGAVSLWAYTSQVPYRNNLLAGYFHSIIADGRVNGPIITTQSIHDKAVKMAYPIAGTIGLQIGQDIDFDVNTPKYPALGGIGLYGIQGEGLNIVDINMLPANESYTFEKGKIYNLESSDYIKVENGGIFSDAHSEIDKPEVANAVWSAAFSN
ncbi:MAG: hypothetical protein ACFKPT_21405 [Gloeotrichia echinulata GP01]